MNKYIFDVIVILGAAAILVFLNDFGLMDKYMKLPLIPLLIAYYLGQYSQRRFGKRKNK